MTFHEELAPKVHKIRREAIRVYEERLNLLGFDVSHHSTLSYTDMPVPPSEGAGLYEEDLAFYQHAYDTFRSNLDALQERFESYYYLGDLHFDLIQLSGRLGGKDPARVASAGVPNTVHDRVHYAATHWVAQLAEPKEDERYRFWSGRAADRFNDRFLEPFQLAAEQQMACTKILAIVVQALVEGVAGAKEDLLAIADACLAKLADPEGNGSGELNAISLLATAFGLFLTGEAAVVAGVVSLGSGISSSLTAHHRPAKKWSIDGNEADEIILSTADAITTLERSLADEDADMGDGLDHDVDSPQAFASSGLRLDRPEIADNPAGMGEVASTDASVVVAEVERIYRAGYVRLPAAAAEYDEASVQLLAGGSPTRLGDRFPKTQSAVQSARTALDGVLRSTSQSLRDAGAALVTTATGYQFVDADSHRQFQQVVDTTAPAPPASSLGHRYLGRF